MYEIIVALQMLVVLPLTLTATQEIKPRPSRSFYRWRNDLTPLEFQFSEDPSSGKCQSHTQTHFLLTPFSALFNRKCFFSEKKLEFTGSYCFF